MFLEAPKDALTVKVGPGDTAARLGTLHFLIFCSRMSLQNLPHMFPLVSSVQTQCSRFRLESPSDVRRFLSLIAEPRRC